MLHAAVEDVEARDRRRLVHASRSTATCRSCAPTPAQLERAFANLLENARALLRRASRCRCARASVGDAAGRAGRRPRARASRRPSSERVFEPFYRGGDPGGPAHRARGSGSRSPRASSRPTAARMRVESLPGQGATFVVELPLSGPLEAAAA